MATVTTRRRLSNNKDRTSSPSRRAGALTWKISDAAFVATLKARGVTFSLDGENLRVDAPRGALSDFDQERLWQHLEGVRTVLAGEQHRVPAAAR
jgi:hypothetical protein